MNKYLANVAKKVKEINDFYKQNDGYMNSSELLELVEEKVKEVVKYAEEHSVPLKLTTESIIRNVQNTEVGEYIEEESSEDYYEDSDC